MSFFIIEGWDKIFKKQFKNLVHIDIWFSRWIYLQQLLLSFEQVSKEVLSQCKILEHLIRFYAYNSQRFRIMKAHCSFGCVFPGKFINEIKSMKSWGITKLKSWEISPFASHLFKGAIHQWRPHISQKLFAQAGKNLWAKYLFMNEAYSAGLYEQKVWKQ